MSIDYADLGGWYGLWSGAVGMEILGRELGEGATTVLAGLTKTALGTTCEQQQKQSSSFGSSRSLSGSLGIDSEVDLKLTA